MAIRFICLFVDLCAGYSGLCNRNGSAATLECHIGVALPRLSATISRGHRERISYPAFCPDRHPSNQPAPPAGQQTLDIPAENQFVGCVVKI